MTGARRHGTSLEAACSGLTMVFWTVFVVSAANYSRPNEPPVKPAFIPLGAHQIRPAGWALEWALKAKEAAIQAQSYPFKDNYWLSGSSGGWGAEAEMYWIEGLTKLGYLLDDETIKGKALQYLNASINRGIASGHIAPNAGADWEDYFTNHIGYSMLSHYAATKDKRVIDAYNSVFTKKSLTPIPLVDRYGVFRNSTIHEWRKRYCVEICTEMFSLGADSALLKYAKKQWLEMDPMILTYFEQKKEFTSLWEHGFSIESFIQNYLIGYVWTGKQEYLDAAMNLNEFMESHNRQPTGASTSGEWFNGTGGFKKSEICGMVPNLPANAWFLRVLGESRYADRLEKNVFNSCLNAIDERHYGRYFSTPNNVRTSLDGKSYNYPDFRMPGYGINAGAYVFCCAGSMFRILANYLPNAWMATYDNGLAATAFAPCMLRALAGDGVEVTIAEETAYPFDETVTLRVTPSRPVAFPLHVRIPGWCMSPSISVAGSAIGATPDAKGFVKISRTWSTGDVVNIRFPMKPRIVVAREIECLKPDSFSLGGGRGCTREDEKCYLTYEQRNPYAAVYLGPVLYGINGDQVSGVYGEWRYALHVGNVQQFESGITMGQPVKKQMKWPMMPSFKPLTVKAMRFDWRAKTGSEWNCDHFCNSSTLNVQIPSAVPLDNSMMETIELVPMGATQYHVSMFPVAGDAVSASDGATSHRIAQGAAPVVTRTGATITITVDGVAHDAALIVYTPDGRVVSRIDCGGRNPISWVAPSRQVYLCRLSGRGKELLFRLVP